MWVRFLGQMSCRQSFPYFARNAGGIQTELLGTIRILLLYGLHLFFVHATAMHLELGQSTVDPFHVFSGQYKFGGFDVLLKVLDFARSRYRNDERLLGQEPCERQRAVVAFFLFSCSLSLFTKLLFSARINELHVTPLYMGFEHCENASGY